MTSTLAPPCSGPHSAQTAGGARGEQVGLRRAHHPHGRSAAILLVVAVQDEQQVQRVLHFPRHDVLAVRDREHHVQEIGAVAQVRVGIVERQPERAAVGERGDRADLADQPGGDLFQRAFVLQGEKLLVVAGQVAQRGREDGHRRGVGRNVIELVLHALVQQFVGGQQLAEAIEFLAPAAAGRRSAARPPRRSSAWSVNCSMGMPR